MGRLDTKGPQATAVMADLARLDARGLIVNRPAGGRDWQAIRWPDQETAVQRLRQRIFKAAQAGDVARVRNLQKLMLRSRANTLVSVRRVTTRNAGHRTAGIDGQLALTDVARADLATALHAASATGPGFALPVRRVYIPKKDGKRRPLGIPIIADRAQQQRVRNALEPEWEARLDPKQYGFRPGRGCHDAITMIHRCLAARNAKRQWILDADLKAAFDRIDHGFLLDRIGTFPAREQIRAWLKAGVVDQGRYAPTIEGTPQGGVISPLLLNIALQGLEAAAGVAYDARGNVMTGCPTVITYADDFVALCHSREQAETVAGRISDWLKPRGLSLNQEKTSIRHIDDGFDFLSFTIRRFHVQTGTKVLTKPSNAAVKKIKARNAAEMRALRGVSPAVMIGRLNPIIRGQANYYRNGVSKKTFQALDSHLWRHLYRWGIHRHPKKNRTWVAARYFGPFHPTRHDKWIFGDRDSGTYLHKYAWTTIVRHIPVPGRASPDDPALTGYWRKRRQRRPPPQLAPTILAAVRNQDGRCPDCGDLLLYADHPPDSPATWEAWYAGIGTALRRAAITQHGRARTRLMHTSCARRHPDVDDQQPDQTSAP